ncbi:MULTISPECIES: GDSL-type esterase/lipase family protein [unclassified Thioalkalivibrio]|uniref:GDSL-type esterase/lipase family protein n=1 Tax=unclassified Thioalkalivibrio TaxID=2621013 RepID=UPI00036BE533|nr:MULTISPECIES: GDSL-type esterase/lipase family protein [unclassified Thioalkalivibrio]
MKAWLRAGFLFLLPIVLAACGGAGPDDFDPLPRQATVLAFGDSVTHGTGAGVGEDYPTRLATITGWTVINDGVPGDRANGARDRLGPSLRAHEPDLVLIWLGGNDFLRQRDPAAVKEDLRALVGTVRGHGAQPVLLGVPRASALGAATGRLRDDPVYRELAREEQVALIEGVLSGVLSERELRADPVHPNGRGYRRIASEIAEALDDLGLWLAP